MARKRRGYLKLFNNAYSGESFSSLLSNREYFVGHLFWVILSRANQLDKSEFEERLSYFTQILRVSRPKVERELAKMCSFFDCISVTIRADLAQISIGNYAEYQENRGQKTIKNVPKQVTKNAPMINEYMINDKMSNKIHETSNEVSTTALEKSSTEASPKTKKSISIFDAKSPEDVFQNLSKSTVDRWISLYPDPDWMKRTLLKAIGWYLDNGNKKPKSRRGWSHALSSWLDRDWSKTARFNKGKPSDDTNWDVVFGRDTTT